MLEGNSWGFRNSSDSVVGQGFPLGCSAVMHRRPAALRSRRNESLTGFFPPLNQQQKSTELGNFHSNDFWDWLQIPAQQRERRGESGDIFIHILPLNIWSTSQMPDNVWKLPPPPPRGLSRNSYYKSVWMFSHMNVCLSCYVRLSSRLLLTRMKTQ